MRASREGFESATIVTVSEEDTHPLSVYLKSLEPALPITPGSYTGVRVRRIQLAVENLSGFRYLTMMGDAPTSEPAISTEISLTIPFSGDFGSCHLKSDRGGANDCSHVPADLIIEYYRCSSRQDTMVFTKR